MSDSHSIGQAASLACILEVTAPKPGNVHRAADFEDCALNDFLASAVAIAPHMDRAGQVPVGETILRSIAATRTVTTANTHLGIVLLLAPLAAGAATHPADLRTGVKSALSKLTASDSKLVYQAIQLAKPGGINATDESPGAADMDVNGDAPDDLITAMRAAESYDMVARQYSNGFADVFDFVTPRLCEATTDRETMSLPDRIVFTQLQLMAEYPDSLIQRKCGKQTAAEASARAANVIASGAIGSDPYNACLADLDFWLRSDGNRRNPGTTADLIAAGLYVALWEGRIGAPYG